MKNFNEFILYCDIDLDNLPKLITITTNVDEDHDMIQIMIEDVCLIHMGRYSYYVNELIQILKNGFLDLNFNVTFKKGEFSYGD